MRFCTRLIALASVILTTIVLGSDFVYAEPCIPCEQLATMDFGSDVTITSAKTVPGEREYCDVRGTIWPEIEFVIKLLTEWNNRFYMVGNGGAGGIVHEWAMSPALAKGFATTGNNTGHTTSRPFQVDWSFAYNPPDNSDPTAEQKIIDYAYRANHENAVLAKKVIKAYY